MVCILVHNLELTRMDNLRSLDLNLLTVFEAIYDAQNITEAAKRLGLTQSAQVTRYVASGKRCAMICLSGAATD
jgi:Bacterial regulatory helix-turn-helix protein, lysR family